MAQPHYQNQFKGVLGTGAWPGTLNIDLYGDNLSNYKGLRVLAGLEEGERAQASVLQRLQSEAGTAIREAGTAIREAGRAIEARMAIEVRMWARQRRCQCWL